MEVIGPMAATNTPNQLAPKRIFIVSDATGETAYRVVRAVLAQFKDVLIDLEWRQGIRSIPQIIEVVDQAAGVGGLIVHTLIVPEQRQVLLDESRKRGVECIDVIGPVLIHFSDWVQLEPLHQPGLTRQLDEDYFRRITALEFAVQHDDGRNAAELDKADLVLVGVSRTSKTPLSVYLAYRGWLVGNVPIILDMEPPPILFELPPRQVVALTLSPERLTRLRGERLRHLGLKGDYADPGHIRLEVQHALSLFAGAGWPVVNVTAKSIEESATEILSLVYQGDEAG